MADEVKTKSPKKSEKDSKGKKSWFKGLKAEFKKIIWTDRKTLVKQCIAVVAISIVACLIITLVDSLGLQIVELLVQ